MVARIGGVDCDQRHIAQILAALHTERARRIGGMDHRIGEIIGNAVLVDRDQADRARCRRIAQTLDNARDRQAHAAFGARLLGLDQLAVLRAEQAVRGHAPFLVRPFLDRKNAAAVTVLAENADDFMGRMADAADEPRLVLMVLALNLGQSRKDALAGGDSGIAFAGDEKDARLKALALPFHRLGEQIALRIGMEDLHHRDRRQAVGVVIMALAPLEQAFGLQLLEQAFQLDPFGTLDAEGFRNVTFRARFRMFCHPVENLLSGRNLSHGRKLPPKPAGRQRQNAAAPEAGETRLRPAGPPRREA